MKYKCPSCKIKWQDSSHPLDMLSQPLCVFCSSSHDEKELLDWQIDHIKDVSSEDIPSIIRHLYKHIERSINFLQEEIYDIKKNYYSEKKDNGR